MEIKKFNDLNDEQVSFLESVYFPIFERISENNLERAFIIAIEKYPQIKIGESAIRKNLKVRWETKKDIINDSDVLISRQLQLDQQLHKMRREKLILNEGRRKMFDSQLILDDLIDAISSIDFSNVEINKCDKKITDFHTLFLSDLHLGKYDIEKHSSYLIKNIISELHSIGCENVKLVFAGDVVEGLLRMSSLTKIKLNVTEQVKEAVKFIIDLTKAIIDNDIRIHSIAYVNSDNHGEIRLLNSNRGDFPELNFNNLISFTLENILDKMNVDFVSGDDVKITLSDGSTAIVTHGHQFKSEGKLRDFYKPSIINGDLDVVIYGHFHKYSNNGDFISLPPMVDGDEYTKSLGIPHIETTNGFVLEHDGFYKYIKLNRGDLNE